MSQSKKDRNVLKNLRLISDLELAKIVATALHQDFGEGASPIKQIGQITSANLRAIKNWYEGKNVPSSRYLLILARSSPSILRLILTQIGGEELWDVFQIFAEPERTRRLRSPDLPTSQSAPLKNVRINVRVNLNARQRWFLEQLTVDGKVGAADLAREWNVTLRTAGRDISALKGLGRVRFEGSFKTGRYVAV